MRFINQRVLIILIIFFIVLVLSGVLLLRTVNELGDQVLGKSSFLLAKSVEEVLQKSVGEDLKKISTREKKRLRRVLSGMATRSGNILNIVLIDTNMTIVLSNDKKVEGSVYHDEQQVARIKQSEPRYFPETWQGGVEVLDVILPLLNENEEIYGWLRVILSRSEIEGILGDLPRVLIPILFAFASLVVISLIFVTRAYTRPLASIQQALTKFNEEDFSYRVNYQQRDEFTDTFK